MTVLDLVDRPPVVLAVVIAVVVAWLRYTQGLPWGKFGVGRSTRASDKAYEEGKRADQAEGSWVGPTARLVPPAPPKRAVRPRPWDD